MKYKNKIVYIALTISIVAFSSLLAIYYLRYKKTLYNKNQENAQEESLEETITKGSQINLGILEGHNSEDNCWIVYNNLIFDITGLLPIEGISNEDCGKVIDRDLTSTSVNKIYPYYIATLNNE